MTLKKSLLRWINPPGKLIFLLMIITIVCLGICLSPEPLQFLSFAPSISNGMGIFVMKEDHIEFSYPDNWFAHETPQGNHGDDEVIALVLAPPPAFLNIEIARKQFKGDISAVAPHLKWRTFDAKIYIS